jgi:hypothetical protein
MAYVAGILLERLSAFGRVPFGHSELPTLWVMHLRHLTRFFGGNNWQRRDHDRANDRDGQAYTFVQHDRLFLFVLFRIFWFISAPAEIPLPRRHGGSLPRL